MRKTLFTAAALVPLAVGALATLAPALLLEEVKGAESSPSAEVMARTAGALLVAVGLLNLSVRNHPPSQTLRAVLAFDLLIQILLLPIDPAAFLSGTFTTVGSFAPNTAIHIVLGCLFSAWLVADLRSSSPIPARER